MNDDPSRPLDTETSPQRPRPHPAVLMIAQLLGRQLAREAFEARPAANDNPPNEIAP